MTPTPCSECAPGSAEAEVVAAYREAAKRWHPDRAGAEAEDRMAEIDATYDLVRATEQHGGPEERADQATAEPAENAPATGSLPALRLALGPAAARATS